jgi:hypothetical protein
VTRPALVALLLCAAAVPARAQRAVAAAPDTVVVPTDTLRRMRPISAAWRSLLIPGWGQAVTGRAVTGALFVAWEGTTLYMMWKARTEAEYMAEIGAARLGSKEQEEEDWLVLLVFNHLFSAAEAFVAGHLQDFPEELKIRAVPGGVGVRLPLPR